MPCEKTQNKSLNGVISHGVFSSFCAHFSSFGVAHFIFLSFRLVLFRLFVISLGVFLLFRLFAWRYFVLAPRHNARRKDEITKWHKQAAIDYSIAKSV